VAMAASAYESKAYDDDLEVNKPLTPDAASQNVELGVVGGQIASVQKVYDEETATQANQHAPPPPPPFCIRILNWFPIRYACWLGGIVLMVGVIMDFIFNKDAFIQFLLRVYLLVFALVIIVIEAPIFRFSRNAQLKLFFWFRVLSRMWGRAWFYFFVTVLCFGEFDADNPAEFTIIAGFYLMVITAASFLYSKLAAMKYNRIYQYIAAGAEGEMLEMNLAKKWDQLAASNNEQKVGSFEIIKVAAEAGRELSNAERHAVQAYLDESCNGHVTKEDWMKQFGRLKTERQRFL